METKFWGYGFPFSSALVFGEISDLARRRGLGMNAGRISLLCIILHVVICCNLEYTFLMSSGIKLGQNLRKFRLKKNLSQDNLAKILNVDRAYISNIENGRMNPTLSTLEKIAKALGISSSELLK
jgi:DNA-binding XRE family transcriptional regulator